MLSAKHSLCQLIGRSDGYIINELDLSQLQRKEQYCRDLLAAVNVFEPGMSRLRGIICYEMHAPIMMEITRQFENKKINSNQLRSRLKEVSGKIFEKFSVLQLFHSTDCKIIARILRNTQNRARGFARIFDVPRGFRCSEENWKCLRTPNLH